MCVSYFTHVWLLNHHYSFVFSGNKANLSCPLCSVTAGDQCESYTDQSHVYHSYQSCFVGFCCGSCYDRYCCRNTFLRFSEEQQDEWYSILLYCVIDDKVPLTTVDIVMWHLNFRVRWWDRKWVPFFLSVCLSLILRCVVADVMQVSCSQATGSGVFLCTTTSGKMLLCELIATCSTTYSLLPHNWFVKYVWP